MATSSWSTRILMTKLECHRWQAVHFQMCYSRLKPQAKCLRWCFHRHLISFPFLSQQDMYVYILHTCQLTNPQNWKIAGGWAFFVERCQEASPKDAMSWQLKISNWSLLRQKLAALPFLVVSYMPSSMPVICNEDFFTFNDSRIAWILTLQESIWSGPGASQGQVFVRSLWDFESTVRLWIPALTWTSLRFLISMFLISNCRICLLQGLHWGRLFESVCVQACDSMQVLAWR